MSHINHTVLPNNTIQGGRITHVGQLFFDQDLLNEVVKVPPYDKNDSPRMMNKNDFIMAFGSRDRSDPVVEYVLLGNKIEDGVFAWINFGIDSKGNRTVRTAATCYENGCVTNSKGFPGMGDIGKAFSGLADLFKDPAKLGDLMASFAKGFPPAKAGEFPGMKGGLPGMGGFPGMGGGFPGMEGGLLPSGMAFPTELPKGLEMPTGGLFPFPFPFPKPIGGPQATETKASAPPPTSGPKV
jgi:hypothetical protein